MACRSTTSPAPATTTGAAKAIRPRRHRHDPRGLLGHIWGGWHHVTDLWLDEGARGEGLGRKLMETAEAEARADGCRYVHLDSHSFRAPDFYKKLGYEEFSRLSESPLGQDQVFLWKSL
ncbi:MAG: GNAT family N-acetyltransferase [Chloroflexi bacterium]|nr:MAG: GNAT family N-acetyltransferase [Chloroflexota bacterium]